MTPQSFTRALEPSLGVLFRLCRRLTRSRARAEELAQEALLRAFERRREGGAPRAAVLRAAREIHLGSGGGRLSLVVLPGADETGSDVLLALRDLDEASATALWLSEVEGIAAGELAAVFGVPGAVVQARLGQARATLAEKLPSTRDGTGDRSLPLGIAAMLRAVPPAGEPAPPSLAATLRGLAAGAALAAPVRGRLHRVGVVALAAACGAVAVGIVRAPLQAHVPELLALEVAAQHDAALRSLDVTSASPAELSEWAGRVMGRVVHVPPAASGELVGARRAFLFGQPAVSVTYRQDGVPVTLLLASDRSAAAAAAEGAVGTCTVGHDGLDFCVLPGESGVRILAGALPCPALCGVAAR